MWLVLGKDYLLTFPNRSARCLYTVAGCDRVGFSDGEEPPPITCVAARKIVKSPGTEAESPIVPVIPYAMLCYALQNTCSEASLTVTLTDHNPTIEFGEDIHLLVFGRHEGEQDT